MPKEVQEERFLYRATEDGTYIITCPFCGQEAEFKEVPVLPDTKPIPCPLCGAVHGVGWHRLYSRKEIQ